MEATSKRIATAVVTLAAAGLVAWLATPRAQRGGETPSAGERGGRGVTPDLLSARAPGRATAHGPSALRGGGPSAAGKRTPESGTQGAPRGVAADSARPPKGAWEPPVPPRNGVGRLERDDAVFRKAGMSLRPALPGVVASPLGLDPAHPADGAELRRWMPDPSPADDHMPGDPAAVPPPAPDAPTASATEQEKAASILLVSVHVTSEHVPGLEVTINGRAVGTTPVRHDLALSRPALVRVVGTAPGRAREVREIRLPEDHPGGVVEVKLTMPRDEPAPLISPPPERPAPSDRAPAAAPGRPAVPVDD